MQPCASSPAVAAPRPTHDLGVKQLRGTRAHITLVETGFIRANLSIRESLKRNSALRDTCLGNLTKRQDEILLMYHEGT